VQSPVIFDDFGDARRQIYTTLVRGGQFVVVE
jgi:hypothetical protein